MNKHTPGPWTVNELMFGGEVSEHHIFIEPNVAVIERKVAGHDQHDMADARLIAAAPAMLEAVQKLVEWWDREESGPEYSHPDKRNGPNGDAEARDWFYGNVALAKETHELARAAIKAAKGEA